MQANKICFPSWALTGGPLAHQGPFADVPGETIMFSDIAAAGSPMDQWDALLRPRVGVTLGCSAPVWE